MKAKLIRTSKQLKNKQLQIRVTNEEKKLIEKMAKNAGLDVSRWILNKAIPEQRKQFEEILLSLENERYPLTSDAKFNIAKLNDLLSGLTSVDFSKLFLDLNIFRYQINEYLLNYITAMIETRAKQLNLLAPNWVKEVKPLTSPVFVEKLKSLRLYLLLNSPYEFRKRNIFIDSSVGARV